MTREYFGHVTQADGSHIPLTRDQASDLWDRIERASEARAMRLPEQGDALSAMFEAYQRLKELGWREAIYCPKDGSVFEVIEAGNTGVFDCHYEGEWPRGTWWVHSDGDLWPSRPILFRLKPTPSKD